MSFFDENYISEWLDQEWNMGEIWTVFRILIEDFSEDLSSTYKTMDKVQNKPNSSVQHKPSPESFQVFQWRSPLEGLGTGWRVMLKGSWRYGIKVCIRIKWLETEHSKRKFLDGLSSFSTDEDLVLSHKLVLMLILWVAREEAGSGESCSERKVRLEVYFCGIKHFT
jgi:hypothetical protein